MRAELASMMRAVAVRAQQKDLELICDVDDAVPDRLIGDSGKLRQVLLNLVDNAIKFTALGEVQLMVTSSTSAGDGGATLSFSVRDTGIGIPSHLHALIFEAFTQADSSTTRRFGGTGLGLTIASSLTALMGGTITLSSEPDFGSTFTVSLGFQCASGSVYARSRTREQPLSGMRALVVDHNSAARSLLLRWLAGWQVEASAVADGLSAMQVLMASARSSKPVQLLLVDGHTPGMPSAGTRASASARLARARELRVLVVEPGSGSETSREVVIQKPVVKAELYEAVSRLLSPKEAEASLPMLSRSSRKGLRVLVAEDNEFSAMLTQELLSRRGHQVQLVRSGVAALAALDSAVYDVLLPICRCRSWTASR